MTHDPLGLSATQIMDQSVQGEHQQAPRATRQAIQAYADGVLTPGTVLINSAEAPMGPVAELGPQGQPVTMEQRQAWAQRRAQHTGEGHLPHEAEPDYKVAEKFSPDQIRAAPAPRAPRTEDEVNNLKDA